MKKAKFYFKVSIYTLCILMAFLNLVYFMDLLG